MLGDEKNENLYRGAIVFDFYDHTGTSKWAPDRARGPTFKTVGLARPGPFNFETARPGPHEILESARPGPFNFKSARPVPAHLILSQPGPVRPREIFLALLCIENIFKIEVGKLKIQVGPARE